MHFICIAFSRRKTRGNLLEAVSSRPQIQCRAHGELVVIPAAFTEDVRADFGVQNRLDFHRIVRIAMGGGRWTCPPAGAWGLAPRNAGLWGVRASIPTPRTKGA
jgi:hypothetical protein